MRSTVMLVAALVGCGPTIRAPVDCVSDGPVRLEVDNGDVSPIARRDDRGWIVTADAATWAVECDAVPRRVFDGGIREPAAPGLPWLGTQSLSTRASVAYYGPIDPWSQTEPEQLPGSPVAVSGDGLVVGVPGHPGLDPDIRLVHVTFAGGRLERSTEVTVVPYEPVDQAPAAPGTHLRGSVLSWATSSPIVSAASTILANVALPANPSDEQLFEVDLATGDASLLRTGGHAREVAGIDGRFVVFRTTAPDVAELLIDRATGVEIPIGRPGVWSSTALLEGTTLYASSEDETHIILLPELRELWLPGEWRPVPIIAGDADHRALFGPDGVHALMPDDAVPILLDAAHGIGAVVGDEVWVANYGAPLAAADFDPTRPYDLVRVALDGSGTQVVLERVYASVPLADGRWAALVSLDGSEIDDLRGELQIIDPARREARSIAHDVWFALARVNRIVGRDAGPWMASFLVDDALPELLFARIGDDAEARGLYRLAL